MTRTGVNQVNHGSLKGIVHPKRNENSDVICSVYIQWSSVVLDTNAFHFMEKKPHWDILYFILY